MKKSILIFFACVILYTLASAQQVNQDIIPASTGLNIGHSNQRWNGFFRNVDISGTCTFNNGPCFGGGGVQLAGNNTWTGINIFKSLNNIQFADQFAGANCGLKISAADTALGVTAGEIWVNQNCGSPIAAVSISANHVLRFIQGGTYTVSGTITLAGTSAGIAGVGGSMTSGGTTGPVTILKEANGANLPAVVKMTGGGNWMEAIAVDGNKANQTCPSPPCYGIWNFKTGRPALRNVSVQNAFNEGVMVESSATPTNESCCGDIIDVMSLNNGGSAGKILNTSDTKITHSEFEASNIGLELIDAPNTRIVNSDFGGNTLQGLKSTCAAQFGASGIILSNSQFGNNGNADDLFIDAWNGVAQCLSGTGNVITGNQFIGSGTRTANTYDAIKIQNSRFNTVTGNNINTGGSLFKIAVEFLSPSTTEGRDEFSGNQLEGWGTTSCTLAAATNSVGNSLCANQLQNSVTVGFAGGVNSSGKVLLEGQTSGETGITVPNIAGTSHTMQLPIDNGTSGQVLSTDGASPAQLSWVTSSGAPKQALPAFPLINQGASIAPVYAAGVTYHTTAQNWSESKTTTLTGGSASSLTLAAGHAGIDVANVYGYQVFLNDGANSEAVAVTGGTYTFAGGGTITFTPFFSHGPAAYTVGSASSGIQETINTSCGNTGSFAYLDNFCNVTVPAIGPGVPNPVYNTYNVQGTIYAHLNQSVLSGYGVSLNCIGRGPCIQLGDRTNANDFTNITLQGFSFRSPTNFSAVPAYAGVQITSTVRTTNVVTINTATAHGFRPGDVVTVMFTDASDYWGDSVVATVPTATSFTYARTGADILTQNTPGVVALAYVAVLDNANNSHLTDLNYDLLGEAGHFNHFFDFYDDENATIDHFNNNATSLNANANWTGSYVFSSGNQVGQNAPVITLANSSITANFSNCVTVYNSNGLYIDNTVCQAAAPWQFYSSNTKGNFQGAALKNIYSESSPGANPFGTITGSVTSGVFQTGEKWVQATTGAVVYALNAPTGSQSATVTAVVGAPDNSHTWTGQTSLAVYTPTAVPSGYRSPFAGTGIAGLIAGPSSGAATFSIAGAGNPGGAIQTGGAGATKYSYYIVANDTTATRSTSPMRVLDWSSTGTDLIPVQWPRVSNGTDVITYDVIRATTPAALGDAFPSTGSCGGGSGGTCGSVATAISQATACGGTLVCSFQDVGSSTTAAYTLPRPNYAGNFLFWPGAVVSVGNTVGVDQETSPVQGVGLDGAPIQVAKRCQGVASTGGFTVCTASVTGTPNQTATMLTDGPAKGSGGGQTFSKGRLNFSQYSDVMQPHHMITLIDSQPQLTRSTIGYRPAANASDTFIGTDVAAGGVALNLGQLAFGAPVAISSYIGNTGDNTSFLERLTASLKSFKVPINTTSYVDMVEIANPGNPAASTCRRYVDSTTHLVTYLNSVGGNCFGGTVTASGPPVAGEIAAWTTASNLTGYADFSIVETGTHNLTVPGGSTAQTGLIFSGNNNAGLTGASGAIAVMASNNVASNAVLDFFRFNASYIANMAMTAQSGTFNMAAQETGQSITLTGKSSSTANSANVILAGASQTATSGTMQVGVWSQNTFAPTSGSLPYFANFFNPIFNPTGTYSGGAQTALGVYPFIQNALGTQFIFKAGTATAQSVTSNTLTDKFTVDSTGAVVAASTLTGTKLLTATNCTANGTAANPSVVSCSAAPAGAFSCDVAASAGTCTVNTTAVTANSEIAVHLNSYTGTRLTVTCNTAPSAVPAIYVSAISAGTSFTINMPTITVNPACFDFTITN